MSVVQIDTNDLAVTPFFKHAEIENIPKSEAAGRKVMEMRELVEVRIGGNRNFSPVFPAQAVSHREGNKSITYAERWSEQYRAFKEGDTQQAAGTPIEMLRDQGLTPEQLSLCRALKIYSIEALNSLEGQQLKSLGLHQNMLKAAARDFLADRLKASGAMEEIERLKAEIAAMKAQGAGTIPAQEAAPEEIAAAEHAADDAYPGLDDDQIKARIKDITGTAPRGNPKRPTLVNILQGLEAA